MERLYYPFSENKGADQLRVYREADLCLRFRICKNPVFSRRGSCIRASKNNYTDLTSKFKFGISTLYAMGLRFEFQLSGASIHL